jgi:hypothetical protein
VTAREGEQRKERKMREERVIIMTDDTGRIQWC